MALPEWSEDSKPLQLVEFEGEGFKAVGGGVRLTINDEARKSLMRAAGDRPAKVVSVVGLYRTGKSLMLNMLAGTQGSKSSFAVGDSVQACTAGIWARVSKPFGPDGGVCLLLDCEGAGNTQRDRDHDARLFALAVLLSSFLVFNSRSVINEGAIQALAVAASLAQHVHKQHKEKSPGQNMSPAFLWVLRDFTLALEDEAGKPITEQEYLERTLRDPGTGGQPGGEAEKRRADLREAREKILDLFPKRDCMCLVRPVDEEEQLQRLSELPMKDFRPKFVAQVETMRQRVLGGCDTLRSPNGKVATIGTFLALVEAHVEAMNTGAVPELGSIWLAVSSQECGRAADEALRVFSAQIMEITASLPLSDEDLRAMIKRGEDAAREKFKQLAIGDGTALADAEADLTSGFASSTQRAEKENLAVGTSANEAWLRSQWASRVEGKLKDYRDRHDAGSLPTAAGAEAESFVKACTADLRSAYASAAVGPKGCREKPWEEVAEKQLQIALREVASWQGRSATNADVQASAQRAGEDERKKLDAESNKLSSQVAREVEESKARAAKMQEERRADGNGVQNWDAGDMAGADPNKVELHDKQEAKKNGNTKGQQKKCCIVS